MAQAAAVQHERLKKQKIIMITSNKGGTGKTTTGVNLACAGAYAGWNVCAVDFDTQHNFNNWAQRRRHFAAMLPQVKVYAGHLEHYENLMRQALQHEIVIIDTPPGVNENINAIRALMDMADFVIVPTTTGMFDIETIIPWLKSIQPAKQNKVAFLMNRVNPRAIGYRNALGMLNNAGRVCSMTVRELQPIERQMDTGHSVLDAVVSTEKGKLDYEAVWTWVEREINL